PLLALATRNNHIVRALVSTGPIALGRCAPRADGLTALASATFTTTVRVIDRVHGHATDGRADTTPAHCTGLADLTQAVFFVADFANGGTAIDMNAADFTGAQANLSVGAFTCQQHGGCTGRTGQLRALARQHLDAVNGCTDRDVADGQRVAGADGSILTGHQRCTHFQATRSDDVATFAVGIAQQCDMRGAVGVVFQALNLGGNAVLVATEVHQTVVLLVTTATMAHGDVAVVVAAGTTLLLFEKRCIGLALVQVAGNHLDHATTTGRCRFDFYERHQFTSVKSSS